MLLFLQFEKGESRLAASGEKEEIKERTKLKVFAANFPAVRIPKRGKGAPRDEEIPARGARVDLEGELVLASHVEGQGEDRGEARDLRERERVFFQNIEEKSKVRDDKKNLLFRFLSSSERKLSRYYHSLPSQGAQGRRVTARRWSAVRGE